MIPIEIRFNGIGFRALNAQTVFVLGTDGNLWYTPAPFGQVPNPKRLQVDGSVSPGPDSPPALSQQITNSKVIWTEAERCVRDHEEENFRF